MIAYTDSGAPDARPDAPTIVFGHGLLMGGWMFRQQIDALRLRYRCVAVDWRGQGATPATKSGYDMDTLAADAVALIRALDVGPVHWVGLSMGGFVGQRLAARHGELLRSLTLLDTSAGPEDPEKAGRYKQLALALRLIGARPVLGQVEPTMFGPAFRADPAGRTVVDGWARRVRTASRAGLQKATVGVAERPSIEDEISAIAVPTLVAVGADDVATPVAKSERIVSLIPGARLHVIQGSGHSSSLEQPAVVSELIGGFLASI
jgi:pimeloyl-ACP methyl ester carboxylesterase